MIFLSYLLVFSAGGISPIFDFILKILADFRSLLLCNIDFKLIKKSIIEIQLINYLGLKVNKAIQPSLPFYKIWCLHPLMKIMWRVPKFAKRLQIVVDLDQNEILWTNNPFKLWLKIWRPNVQRPMLSWKVVFPNFQVIWV